jgi:hypothetical protein
VERPHLLFVTGKLAEPALRRTLAELAPRAGFDFDVAVLPISVVALAPTPWVARHLRVPPGTHRIILPGLCPGDLDALRAVTEVPAERGPKDLRATCPSSSAPRTGRLPATAPTTSPSSPRSTTPHICRLQSY